MRLYCFILLYFWCKLCSSLWHRYGYSRSNSYLLWRHYRTSIIFLLLVLSVDFSRFIFQVILILIIIFFFPNSIKISFRLFDFWYNSLVFILRAIYRSNSKCDFIIINIFWTIIIGYIQSNNQVIRLYYLILYIFIIFNFLILWRFFLKSNYNVFLNNLWGRTIRVFLDMANKIRKAFPWQQVSSLL